MLKIILGLAAAFTFLGLCGERIVALYNLGAPL